MTDFTFTLPLLGTLHFSQLALSSVIIGALIDSINPCAFGVLIFLMTYLMQVFNDKQKMLIGGLLYTTTVFITYFLAGLGLLQAVQSPTLSYWFYWIATYIACTAAAFEIKDYYTYGKGISMSMTSDSASYLKSMIHKIESTAANNPVKALLLTIPIGFAAAAFELPCTGQVYLAILSMINAANITTWLPWLALYNLIFVAPLLIITVLLYAGMSSDTLETWRKQNRKYMRLAAGILLYFLGAFLLWFTWQQFPTASTIKPLTYLLIITQITAYAVILYQANH